MLWLVFANRHDLAPLLRAQSMQNKAGLRFPAGLLPCLGGIVGLIMTSELSKVNPAVAQTVPKANRKAFV